MLLWYAISTRTYTPPGYQVAPLTTSLYHYADPAQAGQSLDMPAGLPLLISINGQELTEDGQLFAIDPDEPFSVTFLSDRSDNALYRMELHDILPDPSSTESNYGQIIGITSAVPSVVVPPGRLARGRYYMLRVGTTRGLYPGLAGGHLAAGGLPFATSSFEVVFGTER